MEIIAKVSQVLPIQSGTSPSTGNQWQKAIVIVEWQDGQYTKKLALSNMKKAAEFAALQVYQEYKFKIDVTSREYNGKWYTEATCFGWEPVAMAAPAPTPAPQQQFNQTNAVGYPTSPGYAAQPAYPPQPGAPAPQPFTPTPAPAPAPAYNPNQAPYGYPQPAPSPQDPPF